MLKKGQKAPLFTSLDQDGKTVSLKDFLGHKVAIYFYPADMTPTCTVQACNLRDNFSSLKKNKISVIGVSPDSVKSHKKFEQKYQLPFPLISDENLEIINRYGVWGEKQLFGKKYMGVIRTTFLINENGKIDQIINKPKNKEHAEELIALLPKK